MARPFRRRLTRLHVFAGSPIPGRRLTSRLPVTGDGMGGSRSGQPASSLAAYPLQGPCLARLG